MTLSTGECSSPTSRTSRFLGKHGIPASRSTRWLDDVSDVVARESSAMRHRLLTKLSKQSAKLGDAIPLANVDGRLSSINTFIVAHAQEIEEASCGSNIAMD